MSYFKHDNAVVSDGANIGDDTRVWAFSNIQEGAEIGSNCNICDGCFIEKGSKIGNSVTLKNHVCVFEGITLEDQVFVGAGTAFINDRNPRSRAGKESWELEKITVRKGATIGANATIMCGIEIGTYALVGAGSVVTKNVAPHTIVYGNPAMVHGYVCACGKKLDDDLACSCGGKYVKKGEEIVLEG